LLHASGKIARTGLAATLCTFSVTREGFRLKATIKERDTSRRKEMMRALFFPSLPRISRYWIRAAVKPREYRRMINHKGIMGSIVI
jgi:hypothetical protein